MAADGSVSHPLLRDEWQPSASVLQIVKAIHGMLDSPELLTLVEGQANTLHLTNMVAYNARVRQQAAEYAET